VENLSYQLFSEITALGFDLDRLEVQETDTSTLIYDHWDWMSDRLIREQSEGGVDPPSEAWSAPLPANEYLRSPSLQN